jgi:hypothetical protein
MKKKKNNKKAQFYLVATIAIVALFMGFVSLLNYSIKKDNQDIYNFVEELKIEGEKVLDYEARTGNVVFDDFAKNYTYYTGNGSEIYFIVGESGSLNSFRYDDEDKILLNPDIDGDVATIDVEGNDFSFELKPGQNFYFVMTDKYKEQEYFISNIE